MVIFLAVLLALATSGSVTALVAQPEPPGSTANSSGTNLSEHTNVRLK